MSILGRSKAFLTPKHALNKVLMTFRSPVGLDRDNIKNCMVEIGFWKVIKKKEFCVNVNSCIKVNT